MKTLVSEFRRVKILPALWRPTTLMSTVVYPAWKVGILRVALVMGGNTADSKKGAHAGSPHECWGVRNVFRSCSRWISSAVGSPWAFAVATLVVVGWAISGPHFKYSNTWQLVINTGTTIVTFLMVFLIQNTQNRDARAVQLKLDELLRAIHGARNSLLNLESLSDEELDRLQKEFEQLRGRAATARAKESRN